MARPTTSEGLCNVPISIPPGWVPCLTSQAPKMALVTVNVQGHDPTDSRHHLALEPGSFTFCSHRDVHVTDSRTMHTIPFWPWLQSWPTVSYRFAPQDRRAEIANTQIQVLAGAKLTEALRDAGGGQKATVRVDLWSPGPRRSAAITLENVIPLMAGRVTGISDGTRRTGPVTLTVTDGDPDNQVQFPNEVITHVDFPDAPTIVVDGEHVRTIIGPFPNRIFCPQIDRARRRFLIAGHLLVSSPTAVQKGGIDVPPSSWRILTDSRATSRAPYALIEFNAPIDEISLGITDTVTCSGGVGRTDTNVVAFLANIASLRLTSRAKALLPQFDRDFPLGLEFSSPANVLDLLRSRIFPQTGYAVSFRRNELDIIPLLGNAAETRLGVGTGLLFRIGDQDAETPLDSVFNAFEIRCGRDSGATSAGPVPLMRIRRDADQGPPAIQALLRRSQAAPWGRRFLSVDANDLAVQLDSNFNAVACPGGERLADLLAQLHAFAHQTYTYLATWPVGMALDLNDRVLLTDEDEGLDDAPTRVVQMQYTANGPQVTLQSEDAV